MFMHAAVLANVPDEGGMHAGLQVASQLELVADRDLRAKLVKWPDYIDELRVNDVSARTMSLQLMQPYLAAQGIPRDVCPQGQLTCPQTETVPREYLRLARNQELRALLIVRRLSMWSIASDHEAAERYADDILAMIERRLETLSSGGAPR